MGQMALNLILFLTLILAIALTLALGRVTTLALALIITLALTLTLQGRGGPDGLPRYGCSGQRPGWVYLLPGLHPNPNARSNPNPSPNPNITNMSLVNGRFWC